MYRRGNSGNSVPFVMTIPRAFVFKLDLLLNLCDFAQLRKPVIFHLHMNLSQDLAVWGYNLVKTTWISKKIKDEVEEPGISVNEVTKNAFPRLE